MKVFVALLALTALVVADWSIKSPEEVINIRKQCFNEVSLPAEYQEKIKKFEYPDVDVVHKHVECSMKGLGIYDASEGYNVDHVIEQLGQGKAEVRPLVEKCVNDKGAKDAWGVWICMVDGGFLTQTIKEQIQH